MSIATIISSLKQRGTNRFGNTVSEAFAPSERYAVDFADDRKGWDQFDTDQDAWYFGVWTNKDERQILTYAEGDWTLSAAQTAEAYNAEIARLCEFYGEGRIARVIDTENGGVTDYVQDRSRFYIQVLFEEGK